MRIVPPATPIEHSSASLYFDASRLVIKRPPNKTYVFLDRRSAVTWPSAHNKGYTAVYGRYSEAFTPIVLLSERVFKCVDTMLTAMYSDAIKYGCSAIYGDLSDDYSPILKKIRAIARTLKPDTPRIYDSSEWANIERSIPILHEFNNNEALILPNDTMASREFTGLRPDSLNASGGLKPWQRYPAYNALAQCAISWELFPINKASATEKPTPTNGY